MLVQAKDMRVTIPALMFDPQFYVFDFAIKSELTKFLIVEEKNLDLAPFIDNRFEPIAQGYLTVSTRELFALESQHDIERPRAGFIFHHAFVCSTLLSRSLGAADAFFALKEPWIVRRLADFKRARGNRTPGRQWREMFTGYTALLEKNYATGRRPVIKATNVANNLLIDKLRFMPGHPALYLYSGLEDFLISNLKKPEDTRRKMPGLAQAFMTDENFVQRYPAFCDLGRLSFLQVCALIWVANLDTVSRNLEAHPDARFKSLLMDDLLADTRTRVAALSEFFGHQASAEDLGLMTADSIMGADAKHQEQAYSTTIKRTEAEQVRLKHQREIDQALTWIGPLADDLGLMETLQRYRL
ncbi:MAG: hypothetical protein O3B72_02035 [Proteobacteria bacterium]|nr:hypothetical protein [Pseudomonadota bacterium]